MDTLWSIILAFVCVAIGLLSERKNKPRAAKTVRVSRPVPAPVRLTPAHVSTKPAPTVSMPLPLPQEGEHIALPSPTPDEIDTLKKKQARAKALKKHYSAWRNAIATQTILNRNHSL